MLAAMETIRGLLKGERLSHPIPPMDGALSPNDRLDVLETLDLDVRVPDDVSTDGRGGLLVSSETSLLAIHADGTGTSLATFETPISAFSRLTDGSLVVAVDDDGLHHVDAQGQSLATARKLDGAILAGVTALTPDGHGGVYFTVGSTRYRAGEWVRDLMEGNRNGLLGHWIPGCEPTLLRDGLAFPNGVLAEAGGHRLLITESWTHSVSRYSIEGGALGSPQTLIGNLPGYPARIGAASGGGYWLAIFAMRTQLVELILRDKPFKRDMMRSLDPEFWIRPALSSSGSHLEPLQIGGIRRLGISKPWAPPRSYGLVLRIDGEGEVIDSMHSRTDGRHHGITAVREIDGRLVIVSRGNHRLLVAPLESHSGSLS
ncbi:MAG: strictosidine synthase family protein [Sinobacteraceae bacterium]|nr:strictosidine synthase family protein [Nevskiaceae bacterium]